MSDESTTQISRIKSVEELAIFCKQKGFMYQAAEIYGGLAGFFDYGPLGVEVKNNIKKQYWNKFVKFRQDMVAQDGSIITNPKVWKASGHVDNFADLVLTTKQSKTKIRADHFIEDALKIPADGMSASQIQELITQHNLTYNGEEFEEVRDFNLMFQTQVGADSSKNAASYLRPETCQSIFPNFKLIFEGSRMKLPFGICQIGKAFRNEISPRDFIFRCREFEQMEMEYFFDPEAPFDLITDEHRNLKLSFLSAESQDDNSNTMKTVSIQDLLDQKRLLEVHAYWIAEFYMWLTNELQMNPENLRVREHVKTELSHYSKGTFDIDYKYPHGFKEMMGIANRADYDLTQHEKHSKSKMAIFDETTQKKLIPHVIEPSLGFERLFMALISEAYEEDKARGNIVLKLPGRISPYRVAILPLVNKAGIPEKAQELFDIFKKEEIRAYYDKSGSIGRRYARQDEIGTPYCITLDFDSLETETVTIRDRNTTKQVRVPMKYVWDTMKKLIRDKVKFDEL